MCGLTGILDPRRIDVAAARSLAVRMAEQLLHRGPDALGIWAEDGIALGHRRLAILDLSEAGAQPMLSPCRRYVIAYNGEVYNHLDLRRQLTAEGRASEWTGHSDTETLLAAIAHWGLEKTLRRAAGMFAIALWDRKERRLSLARDRMGEKPLYWGWAGSTLVFGSELKALREHPDFPRAVCPAALRQYLAFAYVPAPLSIHPGIYKLEPGCLLEVEGPVAAAAPRSPLRPGMQHGSISMRRYWSLDEVIEEGARKPLTDEAEAIDATEAVIAKSVRRQMISDVPLGAFLSGGIDSSLITSLMQAQSDRPVRTFTVGFENPAFDESPYAAAVAAHLGTEHSALVVTEQQARDVIPRLPELYDEPFADSSQIPTHLVCRAARGAVTVALSGDAGDELFGGYNRYVLGPGIWGRVKPIPFHIRRLLAGAALLVPETTWDSLGNLYNGSQHAGRGITAPGQKIHRLAERVRHAQSVDALHKAICSVWLDPEPLLANAQGTSATTLGLDDPLPPCLDGDAAGRMMALDMRSYLPDDILCKVDRAAMGISLETRVPFLDPSVLALSARIPTGMKIRGGQGKWLLRQVLYRHVPRELIERPKTGFSVPLAAWLRGPLRDWAEDLLSEAAIGRQGLLNPAPIRAVWKEHLSGRVDRSAQLWTILMFQSWSVGLA